MKIVKIVITESESLTLHNSLISHLATKRDMLSDFRTIETRLPSQIAACQNEVTALETLLTQLRGAFPETCKPEADAVTSPVITSTPKTFISPAPAIKPWMTAKCPECGGPKSEVSKLCAKCNQAKVNAARNAHKAIMPPDPPATPKPVMQIPPLTTPITAFIPAQSKEDRQVSANVATVKAAIAKDAPPDNPNTNSDLIPTNPEATNIGLSLREPFTATDLAARLDSSNGHNPATRAYQWLAYWKRSGRIETCGFGQYIRTKTFGS